VNTQLGQVACEAWIASHEAHHLGCSITPWADLGDKDREDWQRAAMAVLGTMPPYEWTEAR
jgi:hypothetical protein